MKIAMLTPRYPPDIIGGGDISCKLLVDALRKKNHDVDVYHGYSIFDLYKKLKEIKNDYDVFHAYNMLYLPVLGTMTKKYDLCSVGSLNGISYSNQMLDPVHRTMLRRTRNKIMYLSIRHIKQFTTHCITYRFNWERDGMRNITVIPNMLDESIIPFKTEHNGYPPVVNVITVGNTCWVHDIDTVKKIKRIQVVGGQGKNVTYYKMPDVYSQADILVAPFFFPATSNRCIIEAMQFGLVVVTTGRQIDSMIIRNGIDGYLMKNDEMPDHISYLIDNPNVCERIGRNAQKRVYKICNSKRLVKEYEDVYERSIYPYWVS